MADDWLIVFSQITGENDSPSVVRGANADQQLARSENVSRDSKLDRDAFSNSDQLPIVHYHFNQLQSCRSVLFGVERQRRVVTGQLVAISVGSFFFLQTGGIRKQNS